MAKKNKETKITLITAFISGIFGFGLISFIFNSFGIYGGLLYLVATCCMSAIIAIKLRPVVKEVFYGKKEISEIKWEKLK